MLRTSSQAALRLAQHLTMIFLCRNCVGQSLAWTSMLASLAVLLGRFRFRLADSMRGAEGAARRCV